MTRGGLPTRITYGACLLVLLTVSPAAGWPGNDLELDSVLQPSDLAVLASSEPRTDLSCQVASDKPSLGFDLRFHSDYRTTVPIKVLKNAGGWLQVTMRVTPVAESEKSVYFVHRYAIPDVPVGAKGEVKLSGRFDLGPGRYRLDWMMRDARQRVCSSHWDLDARTGHGRQDMPLTLGPNMVADSKKDASGDDPEIKRDLAPPLRVKILLNLTPAKPQGSIVSPEDATILFSMLQSITAQPGIARFTLVAFNLREQKIVYRREDADWVDFAALRKAIQSPTAGTIDARILHDPQSETHFVTRLLTDQLGAQADSPDAIIIVGSKVRLDKKVPLAPLTTKGAAMCPIFYLNYNSDPVDEPWPDTIGSALKAYKGALAYNILYPSDLGVAIRELLSRTSTGLLRTNSF